MDSYDELLEVFRGQGHTAKLIDGSGNVVATATSATLPVVIPPGPYGEVMRVELDGVLWTAELTLTSDFSVSIGRVQFYTVKLCGA